MSQIEQYDQRIARIMSKIEAMHDKRFSFFLRKVAACLEATCE